MDEDDLILNLDTEVQAEDGDFYREDRHRSNRSLDSNSRKREKKLHGYGKSSSHNLKSKSRITDNEASNTKTYGREQSEDHSLVSSKTTIISSLFSKNPEIPEVKLSEKTPVYSKLFSNDKTEEVSNNPFGLDTNLMKNLKSTFDIEKFTQIQMLSIPRILTGRDCMVKAPTGSGKTIAYAIPLVHRLQQIQPRIQRSDGPYAIVILPTRELALQSYNVLEILCRTYVWIVPGVLMGGEKKKAEKSRLRKGINILVATPGRLLDHMNTTKCLSLNHIKALIFDEADRLLDMGFENDMNAILDHVKSANKDKPQTVLLSATLTKKVENLAKLSLDDPELLQPGSDSNKSDKSSCVDEKLEIPKTLLQNIVFIPAKMRLITLVSLFLQKLKEPEGKVMVFVSSKSSVTFHFKILKMWVKLKSLGWNIYHLHGDMQQSDRVTNLKDFKKKGRSILFCTNVAARGLDLPYVSCVIQYTCPGDITEYVHRSGRTARMGSKGNAILCLLPSESEYIHHLEEHSFSLHELKLFDILKIVCPSSSNSEQAIQEASTSIQLKFEDMVQSSSELTKYAAEAYQSYIQAYSTYPSKLKEIFQIKNLHLGHIAKSFALREVPQKIGSQYIQKPKEKKDKVPLKRKLQKSHSEHSGHVLNGPKPGKKKKKRKL